MNFKRIIIGSLILGLLIVLISFVPGAGAFVMSLFMPPTIYVLIGFALFVVLLKILYELRNKNSRDDDE